VADEISLGGALKAAYGFWWRGVRAAAGILAVTAIASAWLAFVSRQAPESPADSSLSLVAMSAYVLLATLALSAVYRAAFGATHPKEADFNLGPLGFQVGTVEASVFVASFLNGLLLAFLGVLMGLAVLAMLIAVAASSKVQPTTPQAFQAFMGTMWPPSAHWAPVFAVLAAASVLVTWVMLRLSLSLTASAAERKVRVLSSWTLTRGRVWVLLAGHVIIALPMMALLYVQWLLLGPGGVVTSGKLALAPDIQAVTMILLAAAGVFYQMPVVAGFNAYIYGRVGPTPTPEAKTP
jgi:hypothetical protein